MQKNVPLQKVIVAEIEFINSITSSESFWPLPLMYRDRYFVSFLKI
jgi:hypothetical protein